MCMKHPQKLLAKNTSHNWNQLHPPPTNTHKQEERERERITYPTM